MEGKTLTHYFVITALLLSQWFTVSVMACPFVPSVNLAESPVVMSSNTDMPCHDMMLNSQPNHEYVSIQPDCCDNDCHCPSSACFSVLMINTDTAALIKLSNMLVMHQPFSSLTSPHKQQQKPPKIS